MSSEQEHFKPWIQNKFNLSSTSNWKAKATSYHTCNNNYNSIFFPGSGIKITSTKKIYFLNIWFHFLTAGLLIIWLNNSEGLSFPYRQFVKISFGSWQILASVGYEEKCCTVPKPLDFVITKRVWASSCTKHLLLIMWVWWFQSAKAIYRSQKKQLMIEIMLNQ